MLIDLTFAIFLFSAFNAKAIIGNNGSTKKLMIDTFVILFFLRGQAFVMYLKQGEIF